MQSNTKIPTELSTQEQEPLIEACACPLCSATEARQLEQFGDFKVLHCQCDFVYQSPRLKEDAIKAYYEQSSYYSGEGAGYLDYAKQEYGLRKTFRALLNNLQSHGCSGGSLLEIGCGWGYLLDEAKQYFSLRWGTDYNQEAASVAAQFSDKVIVGGLEELRATEEQFDCIVLNQVIEHVYDPIEFSRSVRAILKPNGHVVMATPNINSPIRFIMGKKWPSYKVPEHVSYFSQATLARMMRDAGLVEVQPIPYPHAFPLSLIASKFGLTLPKSLGELCVWVPTTTVCCVAKNPTN